ncbi:predicted protein, partial [Arabidopsis lyrata subsp. lyrata]
YTPKTQDNPQEDRSSKSSWRLNLRRLNKLLEKPHFMSLLASLLGPSLFFYFTF